MGGSEKDGAGDDVLEKMNNNQDCPIEVLRGDLVNFLRACLIEDDVSLSDAPQLLERIRWFFIATICGADCFDSEWVENLRYTKKDIFWHLQYYRLTQGLI